MVREKGEIGRSGEKHTIKGNLSICKDWNYIIRVDEEELGKWLAREFLGGMGSGVKEIGEVKITVERVSEKG